MAGRVKKMIFQIKKNEPFFRWHLDLQSLSRACHFASFVLIRHREERQSEGRGLEHAIQGLP